MPEQSRVEPSMDVSVSDPSGPGLPPWAEEWPLIGRSAELATIHRALSRDQAGIVLAGKNGVGKTRLARDGIRRAEQRGHSSLWLTPSRALAAIPLGVFAHLPGSRANTNPLNLFSRLSRSLGVSAGGRRLVLGIDDANLLDDLSAALVRQLAGTGHVFILAVVRAGEPAPDAVTALWKEGLAGRLEVGSLTEQSVEELLTAVLNGPVSTQTSQYIWDLSRGDPLQLRELVITGLETGTLTRVNHGWEWRGPLTVSSRLADVIGTTLGPLDLDEIAVLEVLAQGEQLEARILESMFPARLLSAAERRGLITSRQDGSRLVLSLPSPLHGKVLRAGMPPLRARAARRELADALTSGGAMRSGDSLRIAALCLENGDPHDPGLMMKAATEALSAHDHLLAERAARAADGHPDADLILAHALYLQGRSAEAIKTVDKLVMDRLEPRGRTRAVALRAQALCWGQGNPAEAEAVLGDPALGGAELAELLSAVCAAVQLATGQLASALNTAGRVLELPAADPEARLLAAMTAWCALAASGRAPPTADDAQWIEAADQIGVRQLALGDLLPAHRFSALLTGKFEDAVTESGRIYRGMLARGDRLSGTAWGAMLGRATLDRGLLADARRWLCESLALHPEGAHAASRSVHLAWLAEAQSQLGDGQGAVAAIDAAEYLYNPALRLFETDLILARAWLAAAQHDLAGAGALAMRAATIAEPLGQLSATALALHTAVRFGGSAEVTATLKRLASTVEGPLVQAYAAHAEAVDNCDGAALDQVAVTFGRLGAQLLAAEAAAEASVAYFAVGRRGRSLSSAATAQALLDHCGGARTPALIGLKVPALTRRERQVAVLAAEGLASRIIAERLDISVRTVDNHLQVTYGKLGVSGRRALADALDISPG